MDYEKKYNDALNLAKSYYGKGFNDLEKLGVKKEPEYYQHFDPDC